MSTPAAPPAPPSPALPRSAPEEQGVPSPAISALLDRWEARGLEPHSVSIARHGHVVAEGSWAPYHRAGLQLVYSVSKTFTACAVGFAVDEGLLRLEDRVVDLFPEAAQHAGPRAAVLTLHDLLAMRTGHRTDTLEWRRSRPATFPETFLGTEPEEEPGWFVYHNGATLMAALAVQRRTGQRLLDYLGPRLLHPLGVPEAAWAGEDGLDVGYSGLHVPTHALTHLGELILRDGVWQGRRLLPDGWAGRMTTPHTDTTHHPETVDWQQGYGYQMWRCRVDAVRADGAYGQFSVIVPGADLVVALTSCTERTQETLDAIWEELLPALSDTPLPPAPEAHPRLTRRLEDARLRPAGAGVPAPGAGPWTFTHRPTDDVPALTAVRVDRSPGASGWSLTLHEADTVLEVPCEDGGWPRPGGSPWTASGGWTSDGTFTARVAAVETPHVLDVHCADGVATARWNGVPLTAPVLGTLRAPARQDGGAVPWSR